MKKKIIFAVFIIVLTTLLSVTAYCEESSVEDAVGSQLENLSLDEFEKFIEGLDDGLMGGTIEEFLQSLIEGKLPEGEEIFSSLFIQVGKELANCLILCSSIIIICILCSTLQSFKGKFLQNGVGNVVNFVCLAAILVCVLAAIIGLIDLVIETISMLKKLMDIVFPLLVTMLTFLGAGKSAMIFSPLMAALSGVVLSLIQSVIVPIFLTCMIFSVIGNISESIKFEKLRMFFKNFSEWLLSLGFGLFFIISSAKTFFGGNIDTVSIKAAKFALSSYVPILGGYLSDGFDIVLAGAVLVKNAIGFTSLLALLLIIFVPVLKLIMFLLAFKLTAGITESFTDSRISGMLSSFSSNFGILIAALLGVGFLFFTLVMMAVYCGNMGVL